MTVIDFVACGALVVLFVIVSAITNKLIDLADKRRKN